MNQEKQTIVFQTLGALEENPNLTQRGLSRTLGIALGAANANMQYCIRSGFVQKSILGRTGYRITEKGQSAKKHILSEKYQASLHFNQTLKNEYKELIERLKERGFTRFLIQGTHEVSDIAYISAKTLDVSVEGFIHKERARGRHLGYTIIEDAKALSPQHAVLFTAIENAQETFNELSAQAGKRRIAVPSSLQKLITTKEFNLS